MKTFAKFKTQTPPSNLLDEKTLNLNVSDKTKADYTNRYFAHLAKTAPDTRISLMRKFAFSTEDINILFFIYANNLELKDKNTEIIKFLTHLSIKNPKIKENINDIKEENKFSTDDQAFLFIANQLRSAIGTTNLAARKLSSLSWNLRVQSAYRYMTDKGKMWQDKTEAKGVLAIKEYSKKNIELLREQQLNLNSNEKIFLTAFKQVPLFLNHYTNNETLTTNISNGQPLSLHSRKKLEINGKIQFNKANTGAGDINTISNDDFVFFSVESGKNPQKSKSRFGATLLRAVFDESFTDKGWLSMHEQIRLCRSYTENPGPKLGITNQEDLEILDTRRTSGEEAKDMKGIFIGNDMKEGMARSIIHAIRKLSIETQQQLLAPDKLTPEHINLLLNTLFRPEAKFPRLYTTNNFTAYNLPPPKPKLK